MTREITHRKVYYCQPIEPAIPVPFDGRVGLRIQILEREDGEILAGPCWDWRMREHTGRLSCAYDITAAHPYILRAGGRARAVTVAADGELLIGVRGRGQILPVETQTEMT